MIDLVYSPRWFCGQDIIIDAIGVIVLFLIVIFCIKSYFTTKKKNYLFISASFFLIFLAFVGKILMNFTIYYEIVETRNIGFAKITYEKIISSDNLYFAGFLFFRIFILFGFYLLYSLYHKQNRGNLLFVFLLILVSIFYSHSSSFIFYCLSFVISLLIAIQFFKNYKENRLMNTRLLAFSFLIISISQAISIFIKTNHLFYVFAEAIQLIGYLLLLATFILVLRNGKKKIQD